MTAHGPSGPARSGAGTTVVSGAISVAWLRKQRVVESLSIGKHFCPFDGEADSRHHSPPHGRVPKWPKGTDCKSVIRGFESHLGLSTAPFCGAVVFLRRILDHVHMRLVWIDWIATTVRRVGVCCIAAGSASLLIDFGNSSHAVFNPRTCSIDKVERGSLSWRGKVFDFSQETSRHHSKCAMDRC